MEDVDNIVSQIAGLLDPLGFETHPFKICWYNEMVLPAFRLEYPDDTLALIIISKPDMFEKAFKPFICTRPAHQQTGESGPRDPIDECIQHQIKQVSQSFPDHDMNVLYDYERHPNNRPKVLVQTAGHVAGAAYYYQRSDVSVDPWQPNQKIHGVSIHPKYGGWFALRCVLIFRNIVHPNLSRRTPPDVLPTDELRQEALERFNFRWQDWTFRDVIPVQDRYSEDQKRYFNTKPSERKELLSSLLP